MLKNIFREIKTALMLVIAFTILIGFGYTGAITFVAQTVFPHKSNGSIIMQDGKAQGSRLMGQYFSSPKYFWGRPSAIKTSPYDSLNSSGSNLGPINPKLLKAVNDRISVLEKADSTNKSKIPVELVTSSASGLDPDISPLAAYYQVHRVAKARNLTDDQVIKLLTKYIKKRQFSFLGEDRVNVLQLNLALDSLKNEKLKAKK